MPNGSPVFSTAKAAKGREELEQKALAKFSADPKERAEEEKCLADVERYGVHVLKVHGDSEWPQFTYSVGLFHRFEQPEVIILGLKTDLAHWILNQIATRAASGERFRTGTIAHDLLDGFDVTFRSVPQHHVRPHFGWAVWFYESDNFPAIQLIYPTTGGVWPWDPAASESFRAVQPVLETTPVPEWARRTP